MLNQIKKIKAKIIKILTKLTQLYIILICDSQRGWELWRAEKTFPLSFKSIQVFHQHLTLFKYNLQKISLQTRHIKFMNCHCQ